MNAETEKKKKKQAKKTSKKKQNQPKAQTAKTDFKTPSSIRIDRLTAAVICLGQIKDKISSEVAIQKADNIYVEAGGKSNLKEAKYSFNKVVKVLALINMMRTNGNQISRSPIY